MYGVLLGCGLGHGSKVFTYNGLGQSFDGWIGSGRRNWTHGQLWHWRSSLLNCWRQNQPMSYHVAVLECLLLWLFITSLIIFIIVNTANAIKYVCSWQQNSGGGECFVSHCVDCNSLNGVKSLSKFRALKEIRRTNVDFVFSQIQTSFLKFEFYLNFV